MRTTSRTRIHSSAAAPARAARVLRQRYQDFPHHNKRNPLRELVFIVCSVKTQEAGYRRTYRALMNAFPTFTALAKASAPAMAKHLSIGGLGGLKAKQLRELFDAIAKRFGRLTLAPLRGMPNHECEAFLTSLPGIGLKVARCIMMYALDRQVFPVDSHCWRVARRLGWVKASQSTKARCVDADMEALQAKIPPSYRFSLHVNLISLGREYCVANAPRCDSGCPLRDCCPRKLDA